MVYLLQSRQHVSRWTDAASASWMCAGDGNRTFVNIVFSGKDIADGTCIGRLMSFLPVCVSPAHRRRLVGSERLSAKTRIENPS
ncbi:MAG: hypothetical protein FJ241_07615 [Nitrospira sp.]|nr:hypothetical protein [Nitrospira sp.]